MLEIGIIQNYDKPHDLTIALTISYQEGLHFHPISHTAQVGQ
jgi:hypothetical protein